MVARGLRALRWALRAAAAGGRRYSTRPARAPAMDYQDAIRTLNTLQTNASYLEQVKRERGDPRAQLEAMKGFLERSGLKVEDLDRLNIIHVTGTKGKGSVCAFAERVLRSYGLKTGFYSSPHLVQVRERIRINGQPISKELFSKYFWLVYNRLEETKDPARASMPAYFRFLTIMAFHVFLQEKVDLAVVEVGIGGAYDCTNIIRKPVVCGVSSLGIDHTSILGDTLEKIAWQKGGIFKPGVPAFTVAQPERPLEVLRDRARERACPLYLCPELDAFEEGGRALALGLAGDHQRSNAALALQLARAWLQRRGREGVGEPKDLPPSAEAGRPVPLAPAFRPSVAMVQGRARAARGPGAPGAAGGFAVRARGGKRPLRRPGAAASLRLAGAEVGAGPGPPPGGGGSAAAQPCSSAARAAGGRVAGPHTGAAPRPRHLVHRRRPHHQQRAGLRPLVPPGRPQRGQAPGRLRGARAALQRHGGSGHGGAAEAAAALPVRLRRLLPQLRGGVGGGQRGPAELQRDAGECPDPLPGEPEDVDPAHGGEGGPGPLALGPARGGQPAEAGPRAGRPAPRALRGAAAQLQLARLPLHLPRAAVDRAGPGPLRAGARRQGGPPAPRGQQRGRAAAGGRRHPRPRHGQPAPRRRRPQAARPGALPVAGGRGFFAPPFT
ncbi:folylpolyglutamate synthase, mitochondrial isoform X2 [Apteryx mantelli]|uniref:Folylpolyglutamate synthase, mitochondrial isoform X2 n=1 Tax=Apteryx mantelli TaxID=2696672 RepID=A0ABM4FJ90_9AVES